MEDRDLEPDGDLHDEPPYSCDCDDPDCSRCAERWERCLTFDEFLYELMGGKYVRTTDCR